MNAPTASLGRRLVGDTVVYGAALAIARGITFLLVPFFARALTAAQFGAYDYAMALNRALSIPFVMGSDMGLALLLRGRNEAGRRRAATSCLIAQAAWCVLLMAALVPVSRMAATALFADRAQSGLVALAALLAAALAINNFFINLLKWRRQALRYLFVAVGSVGTAAVLSAALVWAGGGPRGAMLGMFVGAAVFAPIGLVVCARHLGLDATTGDMMQCLRQGLPFAATAAAELAFPLFLRYVLATSIGIEAVGVFGAANAICMVVMLISEAFASAWWPHRLSEASGEDGSASVMRVYALMLFLVVAALALAARPIVDLVIGTGTLSQSASIVGPLSLAYWFKSVRQNAGVGLVVSSRNWMRANLNSTTILICSVLAYVGTIRWGLTGAAWGFVSGEAAEFVLYNAAFEGVLGEGLIACRRHDEADTIVSSALARCQRSGEAWCVPELMRVRALSLAGRKRTEEAIGLVVDAFEIARSQGALAWELRLASTLAGIDDRDSARDKLRGILNRTSEGFGTRDYRDAVARLGQ